jgi:hypothetical protein
MNTLLLAGQRDFPFTTDVLNFMQEAMRAIERIAGLGGDNYILSGCTITGTSVSSGWVVLNGSLMQFKNGSIGANVAIRKQEATININGFTRQETVYYAEFGTSTTPADNVPWGAIKRLERGTVQCGRELRAMLRGRAAGADTLRVEGCDYTTQGTGNNVGRVISPGNIYIPALDELIDVPQHSFALYGEPALPHRWKVFTNADGSRYALCNQRLNSEPDTYLDNLNRF